MQIRRYRLYGKLASLSRLKKIWQDIVIDFVTGLLPFFSQGNRIRLYFNRDKPLLEDDLIYSLQ
jgi:hypothetical protein